MLTERTSSEPFREPIGPCEFHVSREVRDRCRFEEGLFASNGHAVLAKPAAAHRFAASLDAARPGKPKASASEIFALGLLDEAAHLIVHFWRTQRDPTAFRELLGALRAERGAEAVDQLLLAFLEQFPPLAVYRGQKTSRDWLAGETGGRPHVEVALEELIFLWLVNANPAAKRYEDLFDDQPLARASDYAATLRSLETRLAQRATVVDGGLTLLEFLRAPVRAAPHSLLEQLRFVAREWERWIGDLLERMLLGFDLELEEARWLASREALLQGGISAEAGLPDYSSLDVEDERFSDDAEWMPRTVMIAKSTLVWLDQLARRYQREVWRLDQVPDEELDRLAAFGVNALWLIGVWERSNASRTIKQSMGQHDAAASAYAVHDYSIAHELGGEDAWNALRARAMARGIRLASDMVPNHMGVDSRWVLEHPEWFLQRYDCPYPSYSFGGRELSSDERVSIKIEDHYWDKSDAAVVFMRQDRWTGDTRFIYHGNDGTSFPWNDTAQLDYLNPATREAVIQAILGVARRSPIIRFDAAMTLAKKHIQRLWFPEPGSGGAIPSRAGHGFTRAQFEKLLPKEFWREVVDRVAREVPETLLLAEAFWLMEGYFVRTLGMHRVYNSAFMVMLRDERNAEYRSVLRNTLEFDPDILQRWVNFMNNPDERTAVDQFGRGEKYFGVCTLLATLPGLPMFGHGQIEGFEERYGMEFRRAMRDEPVDEGMEREHWRRIVPLLHRRTMFAGAREFLLYDCRDPAGHVNEDVFAYSNRDHSGAGLVLYNNRYAAAHGTIRWSAAYADKRGGRGLKQRTLLEGLGFADAPGDALLRAREVVSGHEHLFWVWELRENGMRVDLPEFGSRVFLDWQEVAKDQRPWDELANRLHGGGVHDLEGVLWSVALEPAHRAWSSAIALVSGDALTQRNTLLAAYDTLVGEAHRLLSLRLPTSTARARFEARLDRFEALAAAGDAGSTPAEQAAHRAWLLLEAAGAAFVPPEPDDGAQDGNGVGHALRLFEELRLREPLAHALQAHGAEGDPAWRLAARVRALLVHAAAGEEGATPAERAAFAEDADARFAAEMAGDEDSAKIPEWLALPSRFVSRPAPRR